MADYIDAYDAGWRIFPLYPIADDGQCSCDNPNCESPGKHPKTKAWQHTPDWSEAQMAYMEDDEGIFGGNQLIDGYGIVVNTSALLVVDWDGRNGGKESSERLAHIREQCGFIVRTGSGAGEHWYFKNDGANELRQSLRDYPGIDFKSTGYVVGSGSLHESGMRYETVEGGPEKLTQAPAELVEMLRRPALTDLKLDGKPLDREELAEMVQAIPNTGSTDYHQWLEVGMAIHDATGGDAEGLAIWAAWSRKGDPQESDETLDGKWHSFGKSANPVTAGTLVKLAKDAGYEQPVTFVDDTDWDDTETEQEDTLPPRASRIDDYASVIPEGSLVRPVFEWIDDYCLFPRRTLAFATALQAVGNLAGLRYRATNMDTTLNLISFAIADSATGKESVLQALAEIMRETGVSAAHHGRIKSEQEIIRNLVRHQPSFYVVDEYGTELAKIGRAKSSGGAAYLSIIPELIMSLYSKANAYYSLSGDMSAEIRETLERQLAAAMKREDEGKKGAKEDVEQLLKQLSTCHDGLQNPFLSFMGISEPRSFDGAVGANADLMVNGYIGRAVIFREHDAMPRARREFRRRPLPEWLKMRLQSLFWDGHTPERGAAIRATGEAERIELTPEAEKELEAVSEYWHSEGLPLEQEGQGLQTITRRAWETVIKMAAIFSIPAEGGKPKIGVEHVRAAQVIVREITDYKVQHCKTVLGAQSEDNKEKAAGLLAGVLSVVEAYAQDGIGAGVIRNRLRNAQHKPSHIDDAITHLVQKGRLEKVEYKDSRNRNQVKYRII